MDLNIETLLKELESEDQDVRSAAVEQVIALDLNDERVNSALIKIAGYDKNAVLRKFAQNALDLAGVEYSLPSDASPPENFSTPADNRPISVDAEQAAKARSDRWLGVGIFLGLNLIVFPLINFALSALVNLVLGGSSEFESLLNGFYIIISFMPYVLNIGLLIYFAVKRPQVALGMVYGFAVPLGLVIVAGLCFLVACFSGGY